MPDAPDKDPDAPAPDGASTELVEDEPPDDVNGTLAPSLQDAGAGAPPPGGVAPSGLVEDEPPEDVHLPEPQLLPAPSPDRVRAQVARSLVIILAVVVFFSFLTLWMTTPPPDVQDLETLLTIIFGPLVALVSGAVGYYFGGKTGEGS